jgi:hypothetical protein
MVKSNTKIALILELNQSNEILTKIAVNSTNWEEKKKIIARKKGSAV